MDERVHDALRKWPNVPACTGWLMLDRRGQWRMRDEGCQAAGSAGDVIHHAALKAFIQRNYGHDADGQYYFQNGPQRVYVDLAYTPHVVRLHEGRAMTLIDECGAVFSPQACWLDDAGNVLFTGHVAPTADDDGAVRLALLHDHDLALIADKFDEDGSAPIDTDRIQGGGGTRPSPTSGGETSAGALQWTPTLRLPVASIAHERVPATFGFVQQPRLPGTRGRSHPSSEQAPR